ncbi:MAG: tetratricopeptide (TPR) repeat protein [Thermoproteota archaeon]|jgi:tetratricopeptide (TPR) repeat protein
MNNEDFLSKSKAVLILSSLTERKSMQLMLKDLGMALTTILKTDPKEDWKDIVKASKPNIIFFANSSTPTEIESFIKEIELHIENPSTLIKVMLNDQNKDSTRVMEERLDIDIVITRHYTVESLKKYMNRSILRKIKTTQKEQICLQGFTLARRNEFSKLQQLLLLHESEISNTSDFYILQSKIYRNNNEIEKSIKCLEQSLEIDIYNIKAINEYLTICESNNDFTKPHKFIETVLKQKCLDPELIKPIIKILVANKRFESIPKLSKLVEFEDLDENHKTTLSAGILMYSNYLISKKEYTEAQPHLHEALRFGRGKTNIVASCLCSFIKIGEIETAEIYLQKIPYDEIDSNLEIVDLKISCLKETAFKTLEKGQRLINRGICTFDVFEILIQKSLEVDRDKKLVDNLVFEATKLFPESAVKINALLKR